MQFRRDKLKVGQQTDKAQEEPINMLYSKFKISNVNMAMRDEQGYLVDLHTVMFSSKFFETFIHSSA